MTPLQWVDWALKHGPQQPGQRIVLIVLARHAHQQTGLAYPSEKRVLKAARVNRSTFYRALEELAGRGLLEPATGPRKQRGWRLLAVARPSSPPVDVDRPAPPPMDAFWQALGLPAGGHSAPAPKAAQAQPGHSPPPQGGEEQAMFPRCGNSPPALRLGDELAPAGGLPLAGLSWGRDRRWARLGLPAGVSA